MRIHFVHVKSKLDALPDPRVPVGFRTFPGEIWRTPRSWAEKSYPTLNYFGVAERGAAWEEQELFAAQLQAAFRPLRQPQAAAGTPWCRTGRR